MEAICVFLADGRVQVTREYDLTPDGNQYLLPGGAKVPGPGWYKFPRVKGVVVGGEPTFESADVVFWVVGKHDQLTSIAFGVLLGESGKTVLARNYLAAQDN